MSKENGILMEEHAKSPHGCAYGTEKACFALLGKDNIFCCLYVIDPQAAICLMVMADHKPTLNIDYEDTRVWCPLEVIPFSKTDPSCTG